jgi:hypothetical protein
VGGSVPEDGPGLRRDLGAVRPEDDRSKAHRRPQRIRDRAVLPKSEGSGCGPGHRPPGLGRHRKGLQAGREMEWGHADQSGGRHRAPQLADVRAARTCSCARGGRGSRPHSSRRRLRRALRRIRPPGCGHRHASGGGLCHPLDRHRLDGLDDSRRASQSSRPRAERS